MIETVKTVNGHEITRRKGTHGYYEVTLRQTSCSREYMTFRTIKDATLFILTWF